MDLATLEETNRLRVEMGMKPLPVPGQEAAKTDEDEDPLATLDGRIEQGYENYRKVQEAEVARRQREEKAAAVKRARDKAQRHALLAGHTLGEAEGVLAGEKEGGADGDAKAWLRGQKKRQKKIDEDEQRRLAEAAEAEKRKRSDADDDLTGVKVGHDVSALLDGDDQILTLRDAGVLENEEEGDELENVALREREQLEERLELKKKRPVYDPLADDGESGGGHTLLGQYDEEIYGKKRKAFTLDPKAILGEGGGGDGRMPSMVLEAMGGISSAPGSILRQGNLEDILTGGPSSDYLDVSEMPIKKAKKKAKKAKKAKATRQKVADDEDDVLLKVTEEEGGGGQDGAGDGMDVDDVATARAKKRKVADLDEILHDDDSLQAMLAAERREALKKRKRMRPEELARALREEEEKEKEAEQATENTLAEGSGLVIDETAEFISNLKRREEREDEEALGPRKKKEAAQEVTAMGEDDSDEDVRMRDDDEEEKEEGEGEYRDESEAAGLEAEKKISEGMGATLAILRGRGILASEGGGAGGGGGGGEGSGAELNARMRAHQAFIAEKRVRMARVEEEARRKREQDRMSGGALSRMSAREREEYARRQNAQRELQTSKMLQDMFNKSYTPNFQLEYMDEHGRQLNQKEAFRALSHGFHGKSSGHGKTDKMLKRLEAEKRRDAEGILDASQSVGMSSAAAQQLKKRKEAGVRLD